MTTFLARARLAFEYWKYRWSAKIYHIIQGCMPFVEPQCTCLGIQKADDMHYSLKSKLAAACIPDLRLTYPPNQPQRKIHWKVLEFPRNFCNCNEPAISGESHLRGTRSESNK